VGFEHKSVLLEETVDLVLTKTNGRYVDCTLGAGGHSAELLRRLGPEAELICLDQDEIAITNARSKFATDQRVKIYQQNFVNLESVLKVNGLLPVDGIMFDLGVSSPQLDEAARGFSYMQDAPLDMRMDRRVKLTAEIIVNSWEPEDLIRIIRDYGEEKWATRIVKFIVEARQKGPLKTTGQLVEIIKNAIPAAARREGPHPAKRTFQALRIAVNDELGALSEAIEKAVNHLKPQGRLCVITFHSLEDRLVKNAFREFENPCICPPSLPICTCGKEPLVKIITRKPIAAGQEELAANPRARSARLRVCERLP